MATFFNFYLKFSLRCFKIINIIFSHLVITTSAPLTEENYYFSEADAVSSKWSTPFGIEMMLIYVFCESTRQDLLTYCKILHVCVNNQIERSQITWSATQLGNSKNVERKHLFRQHLCRWFFKANCASLLRWFLQTLLLACRHVSSILKEEFLVPFQTMALVSFTLRISCHKILLQIRPSFLTQTGKTMTKPSPRAH